MSAGEGVEVPNETWRSLVLRVAEGDRGAFERLYDALSPRVYGRCAERLGEAADSAFETLWLDLWAHAARLADDPGWVNRRVDELIELHCAAGARPSQAIIERLAGALGGTKAAPA